MFTAHLLNTARFGFSRASFYFLGQVPSALAAAVPGFVPGKPVGAIVIAGSTASNGSSQITGAGANVGSNNAIARNLFTFDDHIFYSRGHHQFELGAWVQRLQSNDNLAQNQFGQASFASLATFLSGTVKTFTVVSNPTPLNWRSTMGAAYVEDTWHPLADLELRGGLRFESTDGWNEAHGRASIYGFTNGVINSTPSTGGSGLTNNRARFLPEPRVGLAWNVAGRNQTSVRAGFGLHHSLLDNLDYRFDQAAPYNTTLTYSGVPIANPTGSGAGLISPSNVQPDLSTPSVLAYDLRVEQQLGPLGSVTFAYVGSRSYHQILSEDQNEPAFVVCSASVACPASLPFGTLYYPSAAKANPQIANTTSWVSGGSGNYNALEVDYQHRLRKGLQLRANYTFSKNLDNGSAWNTSVSANTPAFVSVPSLPSLDYGRAATDVRNAAALNGTYELPLGRGQRLLSSAAADRLVGGWELSTITTLQSGFPLTPQLGYNPTNSGDTRNPVRPNVNPAFTASLYTRGSTAQRAAQFFNPAAFSAPANGTVGNLGRDTLTGPGLAEWDLSLLKATKVTEHTRLQFRAEFFNVLNHTNLQTPNAVVYTSATAQSPTAGVITAAAASRQLQLGLKLLF